MIRRLSAIFVAAALLLSGPLVAEEDKEPGRLVDAWFVEAKAEAGDAFWKALKEHAQWRRDNGDPWQWSFYVAVTGNVGDKVTIRSGGHRIEDLDAYQNSEFSKKASEHWDQNVHPHVKSYYRSFSTRDSELYDWPEGDYKLFWVYTMDLKPGHGRDFREGLKVIREARDAAGVSNPHSWSWSTTGSRVNRVSYVAARANWDGFNQPEDSLMDVLEKKMGEEKARAFMKDLMSNVENMSSQVYRKLDM